MKVKELVELNQMITDIEITVRENGTLRLDQLNIGPYQGIKPRYPTRVPRKREYANSMNQHNDEMYREAYYIEKSLNSWDDGKDYWQVKPNRIPAKWLDLEVFSWEVWAAGIAGVNRRQIEGKFRNGNFHGQRLNIVALPSGEKLEVHQSKSEKDEEQCIDGQMSFDEVFDL